MMKMRVGFAYDSAYPWFNGGIEKRRFLIMDALRRAGHEVHLFTMFREGMPSEEFTYKGVHYHCCGKALPASAMYKRGRRNISWPLKYASLLDLKIWKYRFDILDADAFPFIHIPKLAAYAKLTGARFVVTWHEVWDRQYWERYLPSLGLLGYVAERLSARASGIAIANTSQTAADLERVMGFPRGKITVFPAAISGKEILRFKKAARAGKAERFVVVGRLVPEKRIDLAIRAVAGAGSELLVVGRGPEKTKLIALAKRLGAAGRIKFADGLSEGAMMKALAGARALLMFSEREGMSIVSIESLALGTPVIITKSTSIPQEIRIHCHKIEEEDLAGSLARLVKTKSSVIYKPKIDTGKILDEFSAEKSERIYRKILG
ncbi:MAG: glycosyltransferase family 4 protein [Candidatus Micrarchaeota archaeon]|nr:glycosyltransferase family 4 protein [Candidatus Micrarchaeota archaeon]